MAVSEFEVKLQWENGNYFSMVTKDEGGEWITDIKVEENGAIADIWSGVQSACLTRFNNKVSSIGKEMKE